MIIFPGFITTLAMILYLVAIINVGRARAKYKIKPPAVAGNEQFERTFRVQQNTLEQLMLFLPALWLHTVFLNPLSATLLGLFWLIGRIWYICGYSSPTGKRLPGFIIGMVSSSLLLLGALGGMTYGFIQNITQ